MANYGGFWIDSSFYLMYDSVEEIENQMKKDFFTQRFNKTDAMPNEPSRCKWCNGYFMGKHNQNIRIFQFVYDSILYYWKNHNFAFHYVWLDYVIWAGYSEMDDIRELIDLVPANNENM